MKESKSRNNRKKNNAVSRVITILLLVVFVFSAYKLITIFRAYKADSDKYSKVKKLAEKEIDWDELQKINPDIVGWIRLPDSNIDYPIVQGQDNDKYLHTLFDGSWGQAGCIFADANTADPFRQFNTVVYGHHMKDGTMFNNLKKFKDPEYAKSHPVFDLYTPDRNYKLEVVAFLNCPSDSEIYETNIDQQKTKSFIDFVRKTAEYTTAVTMSENDRYVVLSTCAYEYEGARYVVIGKL